MGVVESSIAQFRNWLIKQCSLEDKFDIQPILLERCDWNIEEFLDELEKHNLRIQYYIYLYDEMFDVYHVEGIRKQEDENDND